MPTSPETENPIVTPQAVQREVRDFVRSDERRRKQFPRAVLVGVLAGLVAVAFRGALEWSEALRTRIIADLHHFGAWGCLVPVVIGATGAGFGVFIVQKFAPEASGSGIPHLKAVLHGLKGMNWRRILPVKFASGVASIGIGLALGREGPTVQMGGAIGQMVSEWLKISARERQTLIAAGAGAGLAAAFNAPLSGMVFVLEEVQRDFTPTVFSASLVASVMADVITRALNGQNPAFHLTNFPTPPITALPAFVVLGVLAGLLGVAFNRSLLWSVNGFARLRRWPPGVAAALVGAAAGLAAWFLPGAVGGGYGLLGDTFTGNIPLGAIAAFILFRFVLTMLSYGCGAPGGIFAPLLVIGALAGLAVGKLTHLFFPQIAHYPVAFAVVGMGALFSAIVRAPLTGIVLIIEMTANYDQMLPLLAACLCAYGVADWLGDRPIYEALLQRDLLRSQSHPDHKDTVLLELTVQPGALFDGKQVRHLALPHGCLFVSLHRGAEQIVPNPDTQLIAGDCLTAVVSPDAVEAIPFLREGVANQNEAS